MNNSIEKCGKYTLIFEKDNKYYAKVRRCKQWTCPFCGEKRKAQLLDSVSYYQEIYHMNNMLTLTTCDTPNALDKQFKKILDCISLLSYPRFKSKNHGASLEGFNNYIDKMVQEESYYIWLLESKVKVKNKEYIPRVHFAIILFERMKNQSLAPFFQELGIKGKHFEKYYQTFNAKYAKFSKYIDLKNRNMKLAYLFYQDFKDLFYLIYSSLKDEERMAYFNKAKKRIEFNVFRGEDNQQELAYIRILEKTQKGRIHYHILTNFYVPHVILSNASTIDTFSSDQTPFDTICESEGDYENEIGKYLVKYVTKDVCDEDDDSTTQKQRLITCSQNITLNLSDHENQGYKYVDEYIGVCEKEFMEINEPLTVFRNRLMDTSIEQTSLYKQRKDLVDLVSNEKRKLEEKYKEEYLAKNEYFDRDNFKKGKNEYIKENIKKVEDYSKRKLELLDNLFLVRSEIVRHKDSPPIDPFSTYYDDELDYWQNDFIHKALTYKGNIALLGGAGCGKSCCISSLLKGIPTTKNVLVCSYTGKATSRLHELIKDVPSNVRVETIHKACNALWSPYTTFRNNAFNLLPYDVCIIDEISMVDSLIFYSLLNALKPTCKIIVVGDFNQLPPCENSSLMPFVEGKDYYELKPLRRIFESEFSQDYYFTRVHLFVNYRSKDIINQMAYRFLGKYEKDVFKEYNLKAAILFIVMDGYRVLCNTNDICRTINRMITINFPIKGCNGYNYRIGQEVMFLRNDMQREFYNGMIGTITNYDEDNRVITINNKIEISFWETKILIQPTYAITIHKSQGSEMDNVIVILKNCEPLLTPQIAYTGITRAKKNLILMKEQGVDERKLYKNS